MTSKAVNDRVKIAGSLRQMLEMHQPELVGPLVARLFPEGSSPTFEVSAMLQAHLELLSRAEEAMLIADEELIAEADDDQQYRDARDDAVKRVRRALMDAAGLLEAAYGAQLLGHYALSQEPPARTPERLQAHAEEVVSAMRTRRLVESSSYGFELELGPVADRLETELVPLIIALEDIRREAREIREALAKRNAAVEAFDETYGAVSEMMHACFLMVGRPDLAAMIQ